MAVPSHPNKPIRKCRGNLGRTVGVPPLGVPRCRLKAGLQPCKPTSAKMSKPHMNRCVSSLVFSKHAPFHPPGNVGERCPRRAPRGEAAEHYVTSGRITAP